MMTTTQTYTARDYQIDATTAALDGYFNQQQHRQLVVLPTGTGKTVVFSLLRNHERVRTWLAGFAQSQQRMLVIAHREELLDQAAAKIAASNPELIVDVEQADRRAGPFADVVVASIQSLIGRLDRFDPFAFRIVVIDEAHHAAAPTYVKVLQHFGVLAPDGVPADLADLDASKMLLGFTATSKRGDDVGLDGVFQRIAYSGELKWFIARGYLSPLVGRLVETTVSLDGVKTVHGDFSTKQLAETVNTPERNDQIVKAWLEHARERKTIAFTCDVAHAHDLAAVYRDAGISAEPISGKTPKDRRRELLREFHYGRVQVLTNCNVLTEGFDEPSVACIVHARPTKSSLLYIQMTGRGTRPAPGKTDCLVLDCVDIASKHSLVTVADLAGLPPKFDCRGRDVMRAKAELDELRAAKPGLSFIGARSFDDVAVRVRDLDLWAAPPKPPVLLQQQHASLAWSPSLDGDGFSLTYPTGALDAVGRKLYETLRVGVDQLGAWHVFVADVALPIAGLTSDDAALSAAGAWLRANRRDALRIVDQSAKWRVDPATEQQLKWLVKKRVPHDPKTISKGEASRLLDIAFGKGGK